MDARDNSIDTTVFLIEAVTDGIWFQHDFFFVQIYENQRSKLLIYNTEGKLIDEYVPPHLGQVLSVRSTCKNQVLILSSSITHGVTRAIAVANEDYFSIEVKAPKTHSLSGATAPHTTLGRNGVEIPVMLSQSGKARKGLPTPTILHAYGGYGHKNIPWFTTYSSAWLEMGGVWATAQVRGGGELGTHWYDQGKLVNKQNTIDDIISIAEWLIRTGQCEPAQLALYGISHGGLLMASVMTQRPELFGCVIIESAPLCLMSRDHMKAYSTYDYGDVNDQYEHRFARSISPVENLARGVKYPPCIVIARENDSRVHPANAFKFVAKLKQLTPAKSDILLRFQNGAGHNRHANLEEEIGELADWLTFAAYHTGLRF